LAGRSTPEIVRYPIGGGCPEGPQNAHLGSV
jgi:hypothetical protein